MDIFVGSIPFKLKESQLREIFEKFGEVSSVTIIISKSTRQNKGFGFVEMPDAKQAMNAIELLNGTEIMGRKIIVSRSGEKSNTGKRTASNKVRGTKNNPKEKSTDVRKNKLYPKMKTDKVIKYGNDEKDSPKKKKKGGVKLAKNFKVGARKKR